MIAAPVAVVARGPRSYTSVMPIPEFLRALRERIGHDHLMLPAVAMAVPDEHGRVLVMRRADDGSWSLPSGILEPGEDPAHGAARGLFEETGLVASVEALLCMTRPLVAVLDAPGGVVWHDRWLAELRGAGGPSTS